MIGLEFVALAIAIALGDGCCAMRRAGIGPETIAAEVAFASFAVIDGLQSRNAVATCAESNPVIGPCGDRVPPSVFYPASIALHAAAAVVMPPRYRAWFQGITLGVEADQVYENHALGYHVDGTWSQPGKVHP